MKNYFLAIAATFFSFFILSSAAAEELSGSMMDPSNDPWESVTQIHVKEDMGCKIQSGFSLQFMKWVKRRVCPQTFDDFYGRLTDHQKEEAVKRGMALLTESYKKTRPPERVRDAAMNKWFLAHTGAKPS